MKKLLLSLFLVLAITCSAQTVKFITYNLKDVRQTSDSIALNAKRTYRFSSEGQVKDTYIYRIRYVNVSDSTDIINVFFRVRMKGANKAMELAGTPEYIFSKAYGKFLDLFQFWKRQINPTSDQVKVSTDNDEVKLNGKRFYFRPQSEFWEISMF